jgi:hypothetical protein
VSFSSSYDITRNNLSTHFLYPQFIASKIKGDKTKRVFWLTSILLFVNCTVSAVVTGTTEKEKKLKIREEKKKIREAKKS